MRILRPIPILLLLVAAMSHPPAAQDETSGSQEGVAVLKPEEAERLFLGYIYDRAHLVRNCLFLGGVKVGEIDYKRDLGTAEIRYRIQCLQEEIDTPPLDRTLKEDFLYRFVKDHWEILGRATEVPASLKELSPSVAPVAAPQDPTRSDRKRIAEEILTWAVLGTPPPGIDSGFPGGKFFPATGTILVSSENLAGLEELTVAGREVLILAPEALLQRTVLMKGGVWLRFESLEISEKSAHAVVGVAVPVLPGPAPGEEPIRSLSRISAYFFLRNGSWTMTRFRPI